MHIFFIINFFLDRLLNNPELTRRKKRSKTWKGSSYPRRSFSRKTSWFCIVNVDADDNDQFHSWHIVVQERCCCCCWSILILDFNENPGISVETTTKKKILKWETGLTVLPIISIQLLLFIIFYSLLRFHDFWSVFKKLRSISVFDGNNNASWSRRRSKKVGGPYKTPTTQKIDFCFFLSFRREGFLFVFAQPFCKKKKKQELSGRDGAISQLPLYSPSDMAFD